MHFLIDLFFIANCIIVPWAISRAVVLGWFDWVKIPFRRNGVTKVIGTDKKAWDRYWIVASIAAIVFYVLYWAS